MPAATSLRFIVSTLGEVDGDIQLIRGLRRSDGGKYTRRDGRRGQSISPWEPTRHESGDLWPRAGCGLPPSTGIRTHQIIRPRQRRSGACVATRAGTFASSVIPAPVVDFALDRFGHIGTQDLTD